MDNALGICKTGIRELDVILGGGIPQGSSVLLAGASGTGKTVLSMEYLFRGARDFGERGLYLSLTEPAAKMQRNIGGFKFYDKKLVDSGMVNIVEIEHDAWLLGLEPITVQDVLAKIRYTVEETKAKRVVIDSLTAICTNLKDLEKIREFIFKLGFELEALNCTLVLISETEPQRFHYSIFGVEEFISDAIILLNEFERNGDLIRTLQIIKVRGADHSRTKQVLQITKDGIVLLPMFKGNI